MNYIPVLLADDHAVVRTGIRNIVEELPGLRVVAEVENGNQLFKELRQNSFDLLLTDISMPDFEPIRSIRMVREQYPKLKILVVSAYDDDVYVQGLFGVGVNGYHLKDQPLSDMKLAVQRVLDGERWISPPLIAKLVGASSRSVQPYSLTPRQQELLRCLYEGMDNQKIAKVTGLSVKTIENHLTRIYRQLGTQSRLETVNFASQHPEIFGLQTKETQLGYVHPVTGDVPPRTILIVDDNPRFRTQLGRAITKACANVAIEEVGDINSAIHVVQKNAPRLALIDVVLSDGEDGIRCTRRIKAISPGTRIVLISAYPDREFHRLGLEAGAVAFIDKKDLDVPTLKGLIDDLFQ